jgi:NADH-quinone oxidoreductase subunit J
VSSIAFMCLMGLVIVIASGYTVTRENPIYAALSMLVALGGTATLYLGLRSPFLATMQVLLYGGAIMVLFTFVIMLLSLKPQEMGPEPGSGSKVMAGVGALGVLSVLLYTIAHRGGGSFHLPQPGPNWMPDDWGSAEHFASFLYTDYVVAFELVTLLVMAAVAGVIVLARKPGKATLERTSLGVGAGGLDAGPGSTAQADAEEASS